MAGNRKAATASILADVEEILPGSENTQLWETRLKAMSDKEFDTFMDGLEKGTTLLSVIVPNFGKSKINVGRNLKLGEKWGHPFFEHLWMPGLDGTYYLTPKKYLVYDLPLRRQAQHQIKKTSIPEDNKSVDVLTGQPTGKSKGSKVSYPELQVASALGLDKSIMELIRDRGGDTGSFHAMNAIISKTGTVSQEELAPYATGVESTKTLGIILTSAHLSNTL